MRQQLVVFLLAGALSGIITAFFLTRHESKPDAGAVAVPVAESSGGTLPSPTAIPQQRVAFKFADGTSLTWTSGIGGVVRFSNATTVMPMWRFLESSARRESFTPAYRFTRPPLGPEPMQRRVNYYWSADTLDFRRPLPVIDFKDYKK